MERVLVAEPMADSYVQLRDDLHVESRYGKLDAEDIRPEKIPSSDKTMDDIKEAMKGINLEQHTTTTKVQD